MNIWHQFPSLKFTFHLLLNELKLNVYPESPSIRIKPSDFLKQSCSGDVNEQVKISLNETLTLTSWSERVQYGAIKEILGTSTSLHLQQNIFVREIFGLGAVPLRIEPVSRGDKIEMVSVDIQAAN